MAKRFALLLPFTLALQGCGGQTQPAASTKTAGAPQAESKADQCLKEAALPREPRKDAPERIQISHVLVRHEDLDRPQGATRSRAEACLRAEEARQKILGGEDFAHVVSEYSDAGQATGGSLGTVGKEDLDPTFANAAFALDVNEVSHVVETPRGFHVIVRTE